MGRFRVSGLVACAALAGCGGGAGQNAAGSGPASGSSIEQSLQGTWVASRYSSCNGDIERFTFSEGGVFADDTRPGRWSLAQEGGRSILTIESQGSRQTSDIVMNGDRMTVQGSGRMSGEFRKC